MDNKQIKNFLNAYEETFINENFKKKSKYFNLISDKKYYLNMLNLPKGRYIFEKNCKDYFLTTKIKNCSNKKNIINNYYNNNNLNLYNFKIFPIDLFENNNIFDYFNSKENNKENFKFLENFEKKINYNNNNNNNQNKNKKHKNKNNNNILNLRKFNLMQIDNFNLYINSNLLLQKINLKLFFNYFTIIKNNNFNYYNINENNNKILTKNSNLLLPSFLNVKNFDFSIFNNIIKFELNDNEKNKIIRFNNYVNNNNFNIIINDYFILFEGIIIKKLLFNNFISKNFFNNFSNNFFINNNNNNLFNFNLNILENNKNFDLKNYINLPPFFFKEENINEIFLNLYNKNLNNNNKNRKSKLKIIFSLETTTKIFPRILPSIKLIKNINNENNIFSKEFNYNQSYLININNNNKNNELKNYLEFPKNFSLSKINKIKKHTFNEINNFEFQNKFNLSENLNDNNNNNKNNKKIILVNDKIEIKFYNKKYFFLYYPINNNLIDFIFNINSCGIILTTEELNDSLNINIYNNIFNTISKNYLFFENFYIFILNKNINNNEFNYNNNNKEKLENYLKEKFNNIQWLNIIVINIITFAEIYDILDNLFNEQNFNFFDYINLNNVKIKSNNKMINIYENFLINNIENEENLNKIKNVIINKYKNKNISLNL